MGNSKTKPSIDPKENTNSSNSSDPFQLQIRNCLRNVRGNNGRNFSDIYPDLGAASRKYLFIFIHNDVVTLSFIAEQPNVSSAYTIEINGSQQQGVIPNFTNQGYIMTETTNKSTQSNDGLPSYEEAIGINKLPTPVPSTADIQPAEEVVVRDENTRDRRHRRHRHRNQQPETDDPQQPQNGRRRRRRRGFRLRRHLAKIARGNQNDQ